ncbi:MAG: TlpA disulfide reductase family protein [Phycisphaerae bacterium]
MSDRCGVGIAAAVGILWACLGGLPAAQAASVATPTSSPAGQAVPDVAIEAIQAQFSPTEQPASRAEADQILVKHMEKVLQLGQDAETMYPSAPNLYVVRQMMLNAAMELAAQQRTLERQQQIMQIAQRLMDSNAPPAEKLQADFFLVRQKVSQAVHEATEPHPELEAEIRAFLKRYEGTPATAKSVAYGVILAEGAKLEAMKNELLDRLEKDYGNNADLKPFLQHYGRGTQKSASSKTFSAQLTQLDGKKLAVPQDVKAKLIVIDFWATWCGPCVGEVPYMKQMYQQFHNRGVEFVGISLDKDPGARERVQKFAQENGMNWILTASGMYWNDPTARKYGIDGIPSVWVIDSQGKVISDDARGKLEKILEDALSHPAAAPSAGATTKPAR